MNTNVKRLRKELQELKKHPEEDMVLYPEEETIMKWKAFIRGPQDTPFAGRSFELLIHTTPLYPMEPPKMKFVTKIFHPNVHFKVRLTLGSVLVKDTTETSLTCVYVCLWFLLTCSLTNRTEASVSTFSSASGRLRGHCGCVRFVPTEHVFLLVRIKVCMLM